MIAEILHQLPPHERRRLLKTGSPDVEMLARRRLDGEPLQYLEGSAAFTDFDVAVDERVLIPRPETEGLFELAVGLSEMPSVVVDLGTGSGVLAIALARRFPSAEVYAVDLSADALEVASANAAALAAEITFLHGDLFDPLPGELGGRIDLLVSNPPYVAAHEWRTLPVDVQREPVEALVAGPRGTEVLTRIGQEVGGWLSPTGIVICEMGETQGDELSEVFAGVGSVEVRQDLAQRPRYLVARKGL